MTRKIRVAAFTDMTTTGPRTLEGNLEYTCGIIDQIAFEKPDVICLTETFNTRGFGEDHAGSAETRDGETVKRIAAQAKKYKTYIIAGYTERRGKYLYNTATVIDRKGKIVGVYDKIHPTNGEVQDYIIPGKTSPTIIKTDFGKIGCMICFDANWPRNWLELKEAGAEIVFFPSAFSAGRLIESMATVFHVPIVAACCHQCCRIVDRDGLILNRQGVYQPFVTGVIDLDNPLFHLDYQFEKMENVRQEYGPDVQVKVYQEEGWWRVIPVKVGLDIVKIIEKHKLEPLEKYFARSTRCQNRGRSNKKLAPKPKKK